jgi:PAS domain-containing protein
MFRFRWLFLIFFLTCLVGSVALGLSTGGVESRGWAAAAAIAFFALVYTAWGEGEPAQPQLPAFEPDTYARAANRSTEAPAPMPLASVTAPVAANGMTSAPATSPFEEYFSRAPIPLVVIGRDGCIVRMNQAAESVTEFAAAEVRSQQEYHAAMLERAVPVRREAWKTRSGRVARFEWWRALLKDEWGQGSGVLAAALPEVEESAPVDLTTLTDQLTAVNGYTEFLLQSLAQEDPMRGDLETIHRAGMAATGALSARPTV